MGAFTWLGNYTIKKNPKSVNKDEGCLKCS